MAICFVIGGYGHGHNNSGAIFYRLNQCVVVARRLIERGVNPDGSRLADGEQVDDSGDVKSVGGVDVDYYDVWVECLDAALIGNRVEKVGYGKVALVLQ